MIGYASGECGGAGVGVTRPIRETIIDEGKRYPCLRSPCAKLHSPLSAEAFIIPVQMSSLRPEKPHKLHTFKNYKMQGRRDVSVGKGAVTLDDLRLSRGPTE